MLRIARGAPIDDEYRSFHSLSFRCDHMKKLQPDDEIVKIDKELGIAWILLPPDASLGGFRGISPRIMDEEKFIAAKKRRERENG